MSSNAKFVTVVCKVGNVTMPINAITLRHTINTLPTAEFVTQLTNTGSGTSINLQQFQELNRIVQQRFYNNFSIVPDTSIEIIDGDGNAITFVGFLMQPQFRLSDGQLNLVFSVVHLGIIFQAFNGSAYNITPYFAASDFDTYFAGISNLVKNTGLLSQLEKLPPINASDQAWKTFMGQTPGVAGLFVAGTYPPTKAPVTNSIAQTIWTIIQNAHVTLSKDAEVSGDNAAAIRSIMNVAVLNANTAVLPYIKNFLMGSCLTTAINGLTAWGTSDSNLSPDTAPLHETIFKILTETPNFLISIFNYIPPFLFQLNATWDGRLAFEPNQFIEPPNGRYIKTPIEDITFNIAGAHELPLAQVIVQSKMDEFWTFGGNFGADSSNIDAFDNNLNPNIDIIPQSIDLQGFFNTLVYRSGTLRFLSKYPSIPTVTAGRYMTVTAPSWTTPTSYTTADYGIGTDLADLTVMAPNRFTNAANIYETEFQKNLRQKQESRVPVLDYLARLTYASCVLDRTNAFVNIPLNLQVQVGRTYDLQSMEGDSSYHGFLNAVTHTITLSGQQGSATTSLDFSHVVVTGAVLNGINSASTITAPGLPNEKVSSKVANLA